MSDAESDSEDNMLVDDEQKIPINNEKVRSGKQECTTAKLQGLMSAEVILAIPDLSPPIAWFAEQSMIQHLKALSPMHVLNKSATFGLGRLPVDFDKNKTKYTLTLVRGVNRLTRFNAYPHINETVKNSESI